MQGGDVTIAGGTLGYAYFWVRALADLAVLLVRGYSGVSGEAMVGAHCFARHTRTGAPVYEVIS